MWFSDTVHVLVIGLVLVSLVVTVYLLLQYVEVFVDKTGSKAIGHLFGYLLVVLFGVAITVGIGLFEANAIQFGLDQLLEAPTPKLITFIHWYYWSQNVGGLVVFYIGYIGFFAILEACIMSVRLSVEKLILPMAGFLIVLLVTVATPVLFCLAKKHFYIQRAGLNPFKIIYRVLKYAWKHKVPKRCSAFTYWEEDIPPRIDLGKDKYGGPFTTVEVEDT